MRKNSGRIGLLCTAILMSYTTLARAQAGHYPLADQVPGDAVAYIGWAGADALGPAYQASDLSAFLDHSNLPALARDYVPQFWEQLSGHPKAGAGGAGLVVDDPAMLWLQKSLPLLWRHPVAIYVSNVSSLPDGTPDGDVALLCDAGPDAAELQADLQELVKGNDHLHVVLRGTLVALGVNDSVKQPAASALASSPGFVAAMKSLQASPAIAVYVDGKTLMQKVNESADKDPRAAEIWPKIRDALGITDLKTYAATAGFDGGSWMTASVMEAPSPRKGLLAVIEPRPLDPALLARIPASAGSVSTFNFDVAMLYDTIGNAMAATKQTDTYFHQATGVATLALGRPFHSQILGPLGPQWVLYSDAASHSVVMLNHPSDADTVSDSLVSATFGIVNIANSQIPGAATRPVVNAEQKTVKGIDLTSAVTKFASPTFAVKDKILYLGLSPDSVVNSATLPGAARAKDLLHTPNFVAAVKRLGVPNFASFDYCDIPDTAPAAYNSFGEAGRQMRQVMAMLGVDVPKVELPPLDQLKTHLSPALAVSWADANGVYSKSISPFPGSTFLLGDPQQSMVAMTTVSAITAAVVPALERARAAARAVQNMSNEHQIGIALQMYAIDHKGVFPPDLGSCLEYTGGAGSLKVFLNPTSGTRIPPEILNGTKEAQAAWVNDNSDYQLLLANKKITEVKHPAETAILVPKDAEHATTRVPVGFADGHCESLLPERVRHLLHPDAPPDNP